MTVSVPLWETLVAKKQEQLSKDSIPAEWRLPQDLKLPDKVHVIAADVPRLSGLLSKDELDITEKYSAGQLAQKLATGEFTSLAVTTAFCKRAAIAQQLVRIPLA